MHKETVNRRDRNAPMNPGCLLKSKNFTDVLFQEHMEDGEKLFDKGCQ